MMFTRLRFTFTRQARRAWLLWLALLLPLAGTAALLHGYGHLQAALAGETAQAVPGKAPIEPNAHGVQGCDLCLTAVASLLGAPPNSSGTPMPAQSPATPPCGVLRQGHAAWSWPFYAARAPPIA
jgi:hypothetical protein